MTGTEWTGRSRCRRTISPGCGRPRPAMTATRRNQLVELAGERGDLDELRRPAASGSADACNVFPELTGDDDTAG